MKGFSNDKIEARLAERAQAGLERRLPDPLANDGLVDLANNDYLGLAQHPAVKAAAKQAIDEFGCSSSASPLITGYGKPHLALKERLLDWYEGHVMMWNSGYVANQALFSVLPEKDDWVFADRAIHHSVLAGLMRSKAKFSRFPHLDFNCLEDCLRKRQGTAGNVFVVTESVFSMDGDCPDFTQLTALREQYGFVLIVDEAHALGWYGARGAGLLEQKGFLGQADVIMGTFGKALGSQGAYLVLRNGVWERYLMNFAAEFIYSTYFAPAAAAAADKAMELVSDLSAERSAWLKGSKSFRTTLRNGGLNVPDGDSPVIPLVLGDIDKTIILANRLRDEGVLAGMVRPPTVPTGSSRLRFSLKANLDWELLSGQILRILQGALQ